MISANDFNRGKVNKMKTDNIEQQLRDYYREMKNTPSQTITPEDIDYNLIAKYVERTSTPEEIEEIEIREKTDNEFRMLLQILTSNKLKFKFRILNFFSLSHPMGITILSLAASLIIITGSFYLVEKLNSSPEAEVQEIILRGIASPTNDCHPPATNKTEKTTL